MPTIISKSKDYDKYLITIDGDKNGNAIKDGEFQSVVADGAILEDNYSHITISKELENETVKLTNNVKTGDYIAIFAVIIILAITSLIIIYVKRKNKSNKILYK